MREHRSATSEAAVPAGACVQGRVCRGALVGAALVGAALAVLSDAARAGTRLRGLDLQTERLDVHIVDRVDATASLAVAREEEIAAIR